MDLSGITRWWILIGHSSSFDAIDWRHHTRDTQLVILSDDPRIPLADLPRSTLCLGYLSVGEIARPYDLPPERRFDQTYLVEDNPNWPPNVRVDVRDERWQRYLDLEADRLLGMGFRGLMLDTIDTAPYLETKDPGRFGGSRKALGEWARRLRERRPGIVLLANGTEALADVAPYVDGFVVEGVFATYDFGRHDYRPTTPVERDWKLNQIGRAKAVARRPVFTIEYSSIGDIKLSQWATDESAAHGFKPYVTVKDINSLP